MAGEILELKEKGRCAVFAIGSQPLDQLLGGLPDAEAVVAGEIPVVRHKSQRPVARSNAPVWPCSQGANPIASAFHSPPQGQGEGSTAPQATARPQAVARPHKQLKALSPATATPCPVRSEPPSRFPIPPPRWQG